MNDPLSIFAAAAETPQAVAVTVDGQALTFGALAVRVRRRLDELAPQVQPGVLRPLLGSATLETIVTLHALFEARVPVLMLHPRSTEAERAEAADDARRCSGALPADAAVVLHTSGTTGRPRGAILTRAALLASARASASNLGWQDDDCWLACMPLARIGGLSILTRSLVARKPVVVAPAFDAAQLPAWIERERITLVSLVPTMLSLLLDAHPGWRPPAFLRAVLLGGAAASPRLLQRAAGRGLPVVVTYGCTETCSQVVATPYEGRFEPARYGAGRPLPGAGIEACDGRILVQGPMLMDGYLGELPLPPGHWFDTGDLGEIDASGCLHVHARRVDLIVTGGENVYPAEVESVLEACPGIVAAGVFGVPDETWGQVVSAALVIDGGAPGIRPDLASLVAHLGMALAPHKRPRRISIVDALPQTAAGKLDRAALPAAAGVLCPLSADRH